MYIYLYIYIYVCMYVFIYLFIHKNIYVQVKYWSIIIKKNYIYIH